MNQQPLFSVIMLTFNRPQLLKEAVDHLLAQTYKNLEIIIIDNAATPETKEYLARLEKSESRVKLVRFAENQYDPDDPGKFIGICFNAGLKAATGEYVFYQEDDDFIGPDYVERMVALFLDNPQCITAAGVPISVDVEGKVMPGPQCPNFRSRYMPGHLLALDTLKAGNSIMFSAPGTIFSIRRDVLIKAGGYHPAVESSQLFGIVPFGVTGFDEKAVLYWRRHGQQLNRSLTEQGHVGLKDNLALLNDWRIRKLWEERYGKTHADFVVNTLVKLQIEASVPWFVQSCFSFSWQGAARIIKYTVGRWCFWRKVPYYMWNKKWVLKNKIKGLFRLNAV